MATQSEKFIHGMGARGLAFLIFIACFAIIFVNWQSEVETFIASFGAEEASPLVQPVNVERVTEENAELAACLEERVGHVEQMFADGLINEGQKEQFAVRAQALCGNQFQN